MKSTERKKHFYFFCAREKLLLTCTVCQPCWAAFWKQPSLACHGTYQKDRPLPWYLDRDTEQVVQKDHYLFLRCAKCHITAHCTTAGCLLYSPTTQKQPELHDTASMHLQLLMHSPSEWTFPIPRHSGCSVVLTLCPYLACNSISSTDAVKRLFFSLSLITLGIHNLQTIWL